MAGVTLEGDWKKFEGHLEKMVSFNFTGLHSEIGEYLVSDTKRRFKEGIDPQGHRWQPSKRAKATGRGKTLVDKARLKNSFGYKASPDQVQVGTNVIYAGIHQYGGVIKQKKRKIRMPRRAFMGINERNTREIVSMVREKIAETV